MHEVTMFFLAGCPYCREAGRLIEKVRKESPEYRKVKINYIDEAVEKEISDRHDYRYVPAFYINGEKLHEGAIDFDKVREIFKSAYHESNDI
ncbi:MAG: thioredoxin family protein [Oscillospiraceae bacterium]|nr:thioredoxin family protein [Oscillospiraceae bacterium]